MPGLERTSKHFRPLNARQYQSVVFSTGPHILYFVTVNLAISARTEVWAFNVGKPNSGATSRIKA